MRYQFLCLTVLLPALLSGCDYLLESAIDCIDADGPVFDKKSISNPTLNQVYSETISAKIENEPNDDSFSYDFKVSGALPAGLSTVEQGREFMLEGTATQLGTFSFKLRVTVADPSSNENSGLCYHTRSRTFVITVQQEN